MRKILITIEYFGKNYAGWQCQKSEKSVQETLERALSQKLKCDVKIYGSGRTDSGVHAKAQKAHFHYNGKMAAEKIALAVNTLLPEDIRITAAEEIFDEKFHAQYSAKSKTYLYRCYVSRTLSPLRQYTYAQVSYDENRLNFDKMKKAAEDLLGTHDYAGFSSAGSGIKNTVRTIYEVSITKNQDEIYLIIKGNGFLYNMVRIIAGTLIWVGLGKLPEDAIRKTLETKSRKYAGKTFPAHGLILLDVEY